MKGRKFSGAKSTGGKPSSSSKGRGVRQETSYIKRRDALYEKCATGHLHNDELAKELDKISRENPELDKIMFEKEAPKLMKKLEENRKAINRIAREEARQDREARKQGKLTVPFSLNNEMWARGGENSAILTDFERRYRSGQIDKATYRNAIVASIGKGKRSWMLDDLDNE